MRRPGSRSRPGRPAWSTPRPAQRGYSLIELVFVVGTLATLSGIAVPPLLTSIDDFRAAGAARYLSARLQRARIEAVMRSADVALQVTQNGAGYQFAVYVDGNRNGVRTREIQRGIDRVIGA